MYIGRGLIIAISHEQLVYSGGTSLSDTLGPTEVP